MKLIYIFVLFFVLKVEIYLADANSDGVVNAIDARLILRFFAGLE